MYIPNMNKFRRLHLCLISLYAYTAHKIIKLIIALIFIYIIYLKPVLYPRGTGMAGINNYTENNLPSFQQFISVDMVIFF